jgi:AcrR family transcriptional regulator
VTQLAGSRLPAAERRQALLDAALRVFSSGSYAGSTTAEIAREAGVSEPILYRHFTSKRELYFACVDEAWRRIRCKLEKKMEELGPAAAWRDMRATAMRDMKTLLPTLWMQAITEAGEDPEIRRFVRRHMREVHDFFADSLRRVQEVGAVAPDRNVDAEAWIFIGGSLLVSVADRLGGPLTAEDLAAIKAERQRWLTGAT